MRKINLYMLCQTAEIWRQALRKLNEENYGAENDTIMN